MTTEANAPPTGQAVVARLMRGLITGLVPQLPARVSAAIAAEVAGRLFDYADHPEKGEQLLDSRGFDGLTDDERRAGFTPENVLGENIDIEQSAADLFPALGRDTTADLRLHAPFVGRAELVEAEPVTDRTVPGPYFPPDTQRDTGADPSLTAADVRRQEQGREEFNLGQREYEAASADGGQVQERPPEEGGEIQQLDPADGGAIQASDPADGGAVQTQDPADGGRTTDTPANEEGR